MSNDRKDGKKALSLKERFTDWREKTLTKENAKVFSIDVIWLLIACCISSFAVVSVMIPNGLMTGGVTGIVRILQKFIDIDFAVFFYIGSAIILVLVAVFLDLKEMRKILLLSVMYPTVLAVFERLDFSLLSEKDLILAAIMCGVLMGVTSGIVFWRGYSFAGNDAIAKILKKWFFPQMSLSKLMLVLDAVIIISSVFVYDRNIALYALVSQVITTRVIDMVLYGFETRIVQMEILTEKQDELKEFVINELDRGLSSTEVCGEYTGKMYKKMIGLCSPRESVLVRRFLAKNDPDAFVTLMRVDTVWGSGSGFKDIDKEN